MGLPWTTARRPPSTSLSPLISRMGEENMEKTGTRKLGGQDKDGFKYRPSLLTFVPASFPLPSAASGSIVEMAGASCVQYGAAPMSSLRKLSGEILPSSFEKL